MARAPWRAGTVPGVAGEYRVAAARSIVVRWLELVTVAIAATLAIGSLSTPPDPPSRWPALLPPCDGFDFPVGAPDAVGYHDAQPFGTNEHLGNDWNGDGGGNSDLGDPVYAAGAGLVISAFDVGGDWGNVVRIVHACGVESLYAHLDRITVAGSDAVHRGQPIGTIGTAGGSYLAHLHFEIRDRPLPLGGGYDDDTTGYVDPTAFIRAHRP
jgi:murein DD-endopeptidase MepM/ murein hydrolase activator NlpD